MSRLKEYYGVSTGQLREALLTAGRRPAGRGYQPTGLPGGRHVAGRTERYLRRSCSVEGPILRLAIERGDDDREANVLATHAWPKSPTSALRRTAGRLGFTPQGVLYRHCQRLQPHLPQMRNTLFDQVERHRHLWLRHVAPGAGHQRQEHAALVDVILARNTEQAADLMRDHLMTPVPIITRVLQARGID